jgi:hypothetical protein
MFEKIWRSIVKLWRKLFGRQVSSQRKLAAIASLPPLDDIDREYLFMQLLEGVAHGWQQPRANDFFHKIRHRVRKADWLEWLDRFGNNLLDSPAPNYELAGRMVQLSQLDCGEIGDLAGEYGNRLLGYHSQELAMDLLPIVEFDSPLSNYIDDEDRFDLEDRMDTGYIDTSVEQKPRYYGEAAPELQVDSTPSYFNSPPVEEPVMETREITIEEFADMLAKDPTLVAELAEQFGIQTTDPQTIVNAVMAQMQAQQSIESNSSDLSIPPAPAPEPPSPPTTRTRPLPPPPPPRRLEDRFNEDNSLPPESTDRRV